MPRPAPPVALILALPLLTCAPDEGVPEDGTAETVQSATSSSAWGEAELVAQLRGRMETARDKFVQMAEAIPEDAWDYQPMEGVRSFGEIFIHVAADNWAPGFADLPMTDESPIGTSSDAMRTYQAEARPKAETLIELQRSFDYLLAALEASRGRMDHTFMFGEREWQLGQMWIALATHMHEHLGQSIAYARANEIVPPWSR